MSRYVTYLPAVYYRLACECGNLVAEDERRSVYLSDGFGRHVVALCTGDTLPGF